MTAPQIFFVDDEVSKTRDYRTALEKRFTVVHISSYRSNNELLDKVVAEGPSIYIQDIMMPRGEDQRIDSRAGIEIAETLRDVLVKLRIPLVLFSNRMLSEFEDDVKELGYPRGTLFVKFKPATGYAEFAEFIWQIYVRNQNQE